MSINGCEIVLWDFNGTIIDDLHNSICTINTMCKKRELPLLTEKHYRSIFQFPVIEYYKKIGFNFEKEQWFDVAHEFIELYWSTFYSEVEVFDEARNVIGILKNRGVRQFVLSAMHQKTLEQCVNQLNLSHCFDGIYGLENHFANNKIESGRLLLEEHHLKGNSCCIIGDTLHDFEVSTVLNAKCVLLATGHQDKQTLLSAGCQVLDKHSYIL